MSLPITTLYALPLIAIWAPLWMRVSAIRSEQKVSIGDNGDKNILHRIRCHGNFIEWIPFALVLMILAESQGAGSTWLHVAGVLLVIGRIAHPFGLKIDDAGHPLRYVGNGTNFLAVIVLAIALLRIVTGM
jgi:hypothetical protein